MLVPWDLSKESASVEIRNLRVKYFEFLDAGQRVQAGRVNGERDEDAVEEDSTWKQKTTNRNASKWRLHRPNQSYNLKQNSEHAY